MSDLRARRQEIYQAADRLGILIREWSPGDGTTRYRFFRENDRGAYVGYFGPYDSLYTALGLREAEAWLAGRAS